MFNFFKKKKEAHSQQIQALKQLSGAELAEEGLRQIIIAIKSKAIQLQQGKIYNDIYVHADQPAGVARFAYVMFSPNVPNEVIARCVVIFDSVRENVALWQVDWAVSEKYRGNNWGKTIATKALTEFCNGLQGKLPGGFMIEAVVDENNPASIKIAEALIGNEEIILNKETGSNVHTYLKHFEL